MPNAFSRGIVDDVVPGVGVMWRSEPGTTMIKPDRGGSRNVEGLAD